MTPPLNLHEQLAEAARDLEAEPDTQHTLERSVALALELVPHADQAGISIVHRKGRIETPAASTDAVLRADELQYQLAEGPSLDAIWTQDIVTSEDLRQDPRWPQWAPQVSSHLNLVSMLCVQLFTSTTVVGGINLYSTRSHAFDRDDLDIAGYLAAHVAVAVAESQTEDQLRLAAVNRTAIGQAQGIVMERFSVDANRAFDLLRRVSQSSNTRLLLVATDIVSTRRVPGV
ncbi:GAF and ANTAR domain-containing protein [Auraticoccus monumenti]|uniref:GAF domain-containing protein n=1 Tax=Auraticoccus monumenti TaxID=675864 RepID=A0A1G7BTU2_9ACTN|nr:GAF and ANTAR domain-containing protein [Auraticoccus monumenti]SDE30392.1 GAF domain-containing protein [Auraticoccus monumenti]